MSAYPRPKQPTKDLASEFLIEDSAERNGVPVNEVKAIADQETGFLGYRPTAKSPAGARGALQVMPATAMRHVTKEEYGTAAGQIEAGVKEYKRVRDKYGATNAPRAYHGGDGAVNNPRSYDPYAHISTTDYQNAVLANVERYNRSGRKPDLADEFLSEEGGQSAIPTAPQPPPANQAESLVRELSHDGLSSTPEPAGATSTPVRESFAAKPAMRAGGDNRLATANRNLYAEGVGSSASPRAFGNQVTPQKATRQKAAPAPPRRGLDPSELAIGGYGYQTPQNLTDTTGTATPRPKLLEKVETALGGNVPSEKVTEKARQQTQALRYKKQIEALVADPAYIQSLRDLPDDRKYARALEISKERPLHETEQEILGVKGLPGIQDLGTFIRGAGKAIGSKVQGATRALGIENSLIGQGGKYLHDVSTERQNLYGRRGGAGDFEEAAGAIVPDVAARLNPLGMGVSTALGAYGEGATPQEALMSGAKTTGMVALGGKLSEAVPQMAGLPNGIRQAAQFGGRVAANTAAPLAIDMTTGVPITPESVAHAAAFGTVFGAMPHGARRGEARPVEPARSIEPVTEASVSTTPIRTAGELSAKLNQLSDSEYNRYREARDSDEGYRQRNGDEQASVEFANRYFGGGNEQGVEPAVVQDAATEANATQLASPARRSDLGGDSRDIPAGNVQSGSRPVDNIATLPVLANPEAARAEAPLPDTGVPARPEAEQVVTPSDSPLMSSGKASSRRGKRGKTPQPQEVEGIERIQDWRESVDSATDPYRRNDILRAVIKRSQSPDEIAEVLSRLPRNSETTPSLNESNILWDIAHNPHTSAETKAAALKRYDESFEPAQQVVEAKGKGQEVNAEPATVDSAAAKEPWQMTRAEFHRGKNLHGSFADPRKGRAKSGDESGFFTSNEESHADFYANSDIANAEGGKGEIYAAHPPKNPLDLMTDRGGAEAILKSMEADAAKMDDAYLDGIAGARNPHRFVRAVKAARRAVDAGARGDIIDSAFRNAAIEHGASTGKEKIDSSYLNGKIKDAGYDAFVTTETNPHTGQPAKVTVYTDRPDVLSHREEVRKAITEGKPVPPEVLAEYPDLNRRTTEGAAPDGIERGGVDIVSQTDPTVPAAKRILNERRAAERAADTDPLTGVANRRALDRALPSAEADSNTAVISFDANNFGQVNKLHGEVAGDEMLKGLTDAVSQAAREVSPNARVFRRGGDEIVVLAPKEVAEQVRTRAEEIFGEKEVSGEYEGKPKSVKVSLSGSVGDTFEAANQPLQSAKAARKAAQQNRTETGQYAEGYKEEGAVSTASPPPVGTETGTEGRGEGGDKERALPGTLEAAGMEGGDNRTYKPETLTDGAAKGKAVVAEKGIDASYEWVKNPDNNGIEWASVGFEAMNQSRAREAEIRATDPVTADKLGEKRRQFAEDFAVEATKRGQAIAGIRAIEEFAPDRAVYVAARASKKGRGKGLSAQEETRITEVAEGAGRASEAKKRADAEWEAKRREVEAATPKDKTAKKSDYKSRLKEQGQAAYEALKAKQQKLDIVSASKPTERGSARILSGEFPALEGDAELLAQYTASRLDKVNTVAEMKAELVREFGSDVTPSLDAVMRRAAAIKQEARLTELRENPKPERKRTILQEINEDIANYRKQAADAEAVQVKAEREYKAAQRKEQKVEARKVARDARIEERRQQKVEADEARLRLEKAKVDYRDARKAERESYREQIRTERKAEKAATVWDKPIRTEATEARERLKTATDPKTAHDDLVAAAAELLLPTDGKNLPRMRAMNPAEFYRTMKETYPDLVTRKNQGQVYKDAYERVRDSVEAAREVARNRAADKESAKMWEKLGIDEEAQAILYRRARAAREQQEARGHMAAEFTRVSRTGFRKTMFELANLPRALQSSIDAPLGRQGLFYMVTHPMETARYTVPATLKGYAALKRGDFAKLTSELQRHPDYELAKEAGVDLPDIISEASAIRNAEEDYASQWAEHLPHVRLSEQGFTLGMNTARLNAFSRYADFGRAEGYTMKNNPKFFEDAAHLVNAATGRGNMPEAMKKATAVLNTIFYSTRLQVSRVQLLNDLFNPVKYVKYDPAFRKVAAAEALRGVIGFSLVYATAGALAKKYSNDVGLTFDPSSPDFGKIRVGKTVYDITGGNVGLLRYAIQFTQAAMRKANGEKSEREKSMGSIALRLARTKLAPVPGALANLMSEPAKGRTGKLQGSDIAGNPANLDFKFGSGQETLNTFKENQLLKLVAPMIAGDWTDAAVDDGWAGVAKASPALAGFGVSTYPKKAAGSGSRAAGASKY